MKIRDLFEGRVATWSNLISLVRVMLAVFIPVLLYYENITGNKYYCKVALFVFGVIFLSDIVDGVLARTLHQVSRLGQFLDPVADKCVILILAFAFYYFRNFPLWLIVLIVLRDIVHIFFGIQLFYLHDIQVRPSFAGKCMAFFMGLSGFIFISNPSYTIMGYTLQQIAIIVVTIFLIFSSVVHWRIYSKFYFTGKPQLPKSN